MTGGRYEKENKGRCRGSVCGAVPGRGRGLQQGQDQNLHQNQSGRVQVPGMGQRRGLPAGKPVRRR